MERRNVDIREKTDEDLLAVRDIVCAGYRLLARLEGFTPEETTRLIDERGLPEAISAQRRECYFIVAESGRQIVGAASIRRNEIAKLYVIPNLSGQGFGTALFEAAERHIIGEGFDEVHLGAFPSAAGFYEAMGMELEGSRINAGGPIDGRMMLLFKKRLK